MNNQTQNYYTMTNHEHILKIPYQGKNVLILLHALN